MQHKNCFFVQSNFDVEKKIYILTEIVNACQTTVTDRSNENMKILFYFSSFRKFYDCSFQ